MKKTNTILGLLLSLLLVFTFASCDNPDATTITPKFTISYITDYGTQPEDKEVSKGYHLTDADLPFLIADDYEFNGWLFDDEPVQAGYEVINNITLIASWTSTKCTITYSTDYGTAPETKKVTKGYKLTDDDLPVLTDQENDKEINVVDWLYNNEPVSVGLEVTENILLVAKWSNEREIPPIDEDANKGKDGYITLKFDVSDINKEYGLSIETPENIEIKPEGNVKDNDLILVYISQGAERTWVSLPEISNQTINGKKYKVLWTWNHSDKDTILQETISSSEDNSNYIYTNVGKITTLKATLKKYGTVTIASSRGKAPEPFEMYETQEIAYENIPCPTETLRRLIDFKINGTSAIKTSGIQKYYSGTGEDVTLNADFDILYYGDIIFVDGSVKRSKDYDKETDPAPLAVVFYIGNDEDKIHSTDILAVGIEKGEYKAWGNLLDENENPISPESYYTKLGKWNSEEIQSMLWTDKFKDYDGADNFEKIKEIDPNGSYPAFEYAESYGRTHGATLDFLKTGWFLPTMNIYSALVSTMRTINSSLKAVDANFRQLDDGTLLVNTYACWTSNLFAENPAGCHIQPDLNNEIPPTILPIDFISANSTDYPINTSYRTSGGINAFAVIKLPK